MHEIAKLQTQSAACGWCVIFDTDNPIVARSMRLHDMKRACVLYMGLASEMRNMRAEHMGY